MKSVVKYTIIAVTAVAATYVAMKVKDGKTVGEVIDDVVGSLKNTVKSTAETVQETAEEVKDAV